jgi:hypothetical protein
MLAVASPRMSDGREEIIQTVIDETLDRPFAILRRQLAERLSREFAAAEEKAAQAADGARNMAVEALEHAVRRIHQASSITEVGVALLETASPYCGRAALLVHKGECFVGWRTGKAIAGNDLADAWARLQIPLSKAPALAQVVESRDAVISLRLADHLSPELVEILSAAPEKKAYLFPLLLRQKVVAILYADGSAEADGVQAAALSLLCSVAEAWIEVLSGRPSAAPQREPGGPARLELSAAQPRSAPPGWESLPPAERDIHLRAQRFARVLVADLQLYRAPEIREGKKAGNLYGRLKEEIDKSREVYQRKFGPSLTGGVDYFHLELVHSVAGDQEELLGPDYPGPIAEPIFG